MLLIVTLLGTLLMSPKRNHLYPIIWVLIIGKTSAGPAADRPDEIDNRKTTTKMNSNKKTSTTNVSAGNSANSMSYEFGNSYENDNKYDYGYDQTYTDFNSTESTTSSTLTKDVKAKAQVPIGPLPLDESTEIIKKDLTVIVVTMSSMCLLIAAVAVGMCYTKGPSRSEIRSSTDRALSRGISLQDGTVHENEQLLDDDVFVIAPIQSQNKANAMKKI